MTTRRLPRRVSALLAPVAALALVTVLGLAWLGPVPVAYAAASVTVSGRPDPDSTTTVRLSGTGFQSVPRAFGGLYVFFGWVSDPSGGSWAPSRGGVSGDSYRYVPDTQAARNAGYQRFVAFPGSSTEAEANGGTIAADGTWSTDLVIPGARFEAADGGTVDCTAVRCGIITIGAHGVRNATNETFTPVAFGRTDDGAPAAGSGGTGGGADGGSSGGANDTGVNDGGAGQGDAGGAAAEGSGSGTADDDPAGSAEGRRPGAASLGVDQATAVVGRVMSFGAQGLEPGEQVTVTLDDGAVAVGPLVTGNHGEVAGLVELPSDLRTGTHVLRLTGASSGTTVETEVTVTRDPTEVAAAEPANPAGDTVGGTDTSARQAAGAWRPEETAVGVAALLLLVVIVSSLVTVLKRRSDRRRAEQDEVEQDTPAEHRKPTEEAHA